MKIPAVLTTDSTVTCAHAGKISADSTSRLRVADKPVLLANLAGKTVDCKLPDDPNTGTKHCTKVSAVSAGESSKLKVGNVSVLLDVLAGLSDGTPPPTGGVPLLPAVAGQTRLRAAAVVA
ncbi:hypothetical protein ACGFIF_28760 [Kribbella sp. NPDC049174]|uniref:hypothetical protein n=1 Tax=Kribbella sp. NPDC049174 TaxID=3364112 RepID=UPI003722E1CB